MSSNTIIHITDAYQCSTDPLPLVMNTRTSIIELKDQWLCVKRQTTLVKMID